MPDSAWQIILPWIGKFSLICLHSVWGSRFILTSGCFDTFIIHFYSFSSDVSMNRQLIMLHVQGDYGLSPSQYPRVDLLLDRYMMAWYTVDLVVL